MHVYGSITYCKQKAGNGREERRKVEEEEEEEEEEGKEESWKALLERDDTQLIGEYQKI
jgi:hypothetical protein